MVLLIICSPISSIHEESLWVGLPAQVPRNTQAFFEGAVQTTVCNGTSTKFWLNRWLEDKTIAEYAPNLIQIIPKRVLKQRMVAQALHNRRWVTDIKGALTVEVLIEYLQTWDMVDDISLHQDIPDHHQRQLTGSDSYSSKSAYMAFFTRTIKFAPWKRIWKSNHLAKRGLPHPPVCPLWSG